MKTTTYFLLIIIVAIVIAAIAAYIVGLAAQVAEQGEIYITLDQLEKTVVSMCGGNADLPPIEFKIPGSEKAWEITTWNENKGGNIIYVKKRVTGIGPIGFRYELTDLKVELPTDCQGVDLTDVDFSCQLPCISSRLCLFSPADFKAKVTFDVSSKKIKIEVTENFGDRIDNTFYGTCY